MDEKRKYWWPSSDTVVIILSLTVICFGIWMMTD
jgi:hypothetical protein